MDDCMNVKLNVKLFEDMGLHVTFDRGIDGEV